MNEAYDDVSSLEDLLAREIDARRRAQCTARVQSDAVQLALDLLVREPDINGFFRVFVKTLVDECDSYASGVWLLNDDKQSCELWMAYLDDRFFSKASEDWQTLALPRESMAAHLMAYTPGWTERSTTPATIRGCPTPFARSTTRATSSRWWSHRWCSRPVRSGGSRWRRATRRRARASGASPSSKRSPARRRSPSIRAGSPNKRGSKSGVRRCSKSAIGWRATSTTRSPRGSPPS